MTFRALRRRMHVSPATVIASFALVFAMSGGAFAAGRYLITSTKQISPKVLKALAGKNGANGAPGIRGLQGPAGAAGASGLAGKEGSAGANGAAGTSVTSTALAANNANCKAGGSEFKAGSSTTYACNGEKGAAGKNGTFGSEPLPQGQTLRGEYGATGFAEAAYPEPGFGLAQTGVSFAVPVPGVHGGPSLEVHIIKKEESPPSGCTGSLLEPGAAEGNLCIFAESEINTPSLPNVNSSAIGFTITGLSAGKGVVGIDGTWAVTAG